MPILKGHDSKCPYYKVYRTKTKYYYLPNNEISRKIAHTKARKKRNVKRCCSSLDMES